MSARTRTRSTQATRPSRSAPPTPSARPGRADWAGGKTTGPFYEDLHQTPAVLWVSVVLMCLGVALIGGGVIALSIARTAAVALFIGGALLGAVGLALGLHHNIMTNVE